MITLNPDHFKSLPDHAVRVQLLFLLSGGGAHMNLDEAVSDFPHGHINTKPPNLPYTFWHLLEHIRIAQWDILDFILNTNYEPLNWPEDYWPHPDSKATPKQWLATITTICSDLAEIKALIENPVTDLYSDLPHAKGYNILREALLVADHNAYHIGEFAILRQIVDAWTVT